MLLSGGSGRRLWPLSNDARAKQFLKMMRGPDGGLESMVQRVWRQLGDAGLTKDCMIVTNPLQTDIIGRQLGGGVPLLVEPESRDTFPAIALAASYLRDVRGAGPNETVVALPVDPYADDAFFRLVKDLEPLLSRSSAELGLIGATPTYNSTKYGYIVPAPADGQRDYVKAAAFYEKPSERVAEELIANKGAMWNCGVFAFRLEYMIRQLRDRGLPVEYDRLAADYRRLSRTSFDVEVAETCRNIAVLPYEGSWKDLGTWNTLTEEMDVSRIGKGRLSHDSRNTHVINELHIPVSVLGLSNIVVAVSPDGILVSDKEASPRLKEVLDSGQSPMYVEYAWGTSRVVDYDLLAEDNEVVTKRMTVTAGRTTDFALSPAREKIWTFLSGTGEVELEGRPLAVRQGSVVRIPPRAKHGIHAFEDVELVEIQTGRPLNEGDIQRMAYSWGSAVI
ncbi:sugar phosphate nucleotidyltransferase [Paenibacillaceae bacterium WGS1546]|uniref:sugar phosphate nucleotidyltransferase n=1 Tax=Cohnella sp. WGS1546 TaxID=3366810 RepID=UPI00372D5FB4